jgi:hypothetical protein
MWNYSSVLPVCYRAYCAYISFLGGAFLLQCNFHGGLTADEASNTVVRLIKLETFLPSVVGAALHLRTRKVPDEAGPTFVEMRLFFRIAAP